MKNGHPQVQHVQHVQQVHPVCQGPCAPDTIIYQVAGRLIYEL